MTKNIKYVVFGTAALSVGLWYWQISMLGPIPTMTYEQAQAQQATERLAEFNNDPTLSAAKDKASNNPNDLLAQKSYATALLNRLRTVENPPQSALLQAIALLQNILQLDPNDRETLISMAEISFSQQVFDKAAEYYARYLTNNQSDSEARARYGSALTFIGDAQKAVAELERAVNENPKSFSSNAYLSIAYSQAGEREKAITVGETALKLAPSDEAFKKFGEFLQSIKTVNQPLGAATSSAITVSQQTHQPVVDAVQSNPVAGSKLVAARSIDTGTLVLVFKSFPMQMMPEVAKNKFLEPLKELAQKQGLKGVRFVDADSGEVMQEF